MEQGHAALPLFIDYGQKAAAMEREAAQRVCTSLGLSNLATLSISHYGTLIPSGLTSATLDVRDHAFVPGRNLLLLVCAASYAFVEGAGAVLVGFLRSGGDLFADQTGAFLSSAQSAIEAALGTSMPILTPLRSLEKADVELLASSRNLGSTYSCHAGAAAPCRRCISCLEYERDGREA